MKTLVKSQAKEGIWLEDVAEPIVGNNDVLIWADEFNEAGSPCSNNWTYNQGTGNNGWGNNEKQYYNTNSSRKK